MKLTKNQLKELIQQSIDEMIEGGPGSGRKGGGDTTGGPSYANVPKGAKTSKDVKKMKKKKKPTYHHKGDDKLVSLKVRESNGKKCTVKEIKRWMKGLEENRYKKTYNSDARRVSWLVNNNLAEDYESMPKSMRKKWTEAKYGRERYLAKEYMKHLESKQLSENKLRTIIKNTIKEVVNGKEK